MSLEEKMNQAEKSEHAKKSGSWFKFQEGENVIRILTEPEIIFEDFKLGICYTDCMFQGNAKGFARILDRADNQIKLMKIPYRLMKTICSYESDEDYGFNGYPMPYDVKIKATKAGTKEVDYDPIPKRESEIDAEVIAELNKEKPILEVIEQMKKRNLEKHKEDGTRRRLQEENDKLKEELDAVRPQSGSGNSLTNVPYPENQAEDIPFD